MLLFNQALRLEYINPAGETLFSASARQLLKQPYEALISDEQELGELLEQAVRSAQPFTRHEVTLQLAGENDMVVDFTAIPLSEPGREPAILVELHPINRLLRISREENQIAQQHASRRLLRGLAHEIKNPLGGLRGAAQLLEKQLDSEELKEYTQVIINEADRLQNLVDRILGPNKLPNMQVINIHTVLEHVRSLLMAEVNEQVSIERDYDPSIPDLIADPEQLIQAILNIARNACQAVQDEGQISFRTRIERKLTIGKQRHDLVVRIDVIDTGPGIDEDMKDKIFFPMITGRANGTGLGLSIAQTLILQHQGHIEFESRTGKTVFSVLLPILRKENSQ